MLVGERCPPGRDAGRALLDGHPGLRLLAGAVDPHHVVPRRRRRAHRTPRPSLADGEPRPSTPTSATPRSGPDATTTARPTTSGTPSPTSSGRRWSTATRSPTSASRSTSRSASWGPAASTCGSGRRRRTPTSRSPSPRSTPTAASATCSPAGCGPATAQLEAGRTTAVLPHPDPPRGRQRAAGARRAHRAPCGDLPRRPHVPLRLAAAHLDLGARRRPAPVELRHPQRRRGQRGRALRRPPVAPGPAGGGRRPDRRCRPGLPEPAQPALPRLRRSQRGDRRRGRRHRRGRGARRAGTRCPTPPTSWATRCSAPATSPSPPSAPTPSSSAPPTPTRCSWRSAACPSATTPSPSARSSKRAPASSRRHPSWSPWPPRPRPPPRPPSRPPRRRPSADDSTTTPSDPGGGRRRRPPPHRLRPDRPHRLGRGPHRHRRRPRRQPPPHPPNDLTPPSLVAGDPTRIEQVGPRVIGVGDDRPTRSPTSARASSCSRSAVERGDGSARTARRGRRTRRGRGRSARAARGTKSEGRRAPVRVAGR